MSSSWCSSPAGGAGVDLVWAAPPAGDWCDHREAACTHTDLSCPETLNWSNQKKSLYLFLCFPADSARLRPLLPEVNTGGGGGGGPSPWQLSSCICWRRPRRSVESFRNNKEVDLKRKFCFQSGESQIDRSCILCTDNYTYTTYCVQSDCSVLHTA